MERLNPPALSPQTAFSHVVRAGKTVYIAGQAAQGRDGHVSGPGDAAAQTRQALKNLKTCLAAVGAGFEHVAKITTFVVGRENLAAVRSVRSQYLPADALPASTLLLVAGLAHPDYLVEIEAVAVLP